MKKKLLVSLLAGGMSALGMIAPVMAENEVTLTYTVEEKDAVPTFHLSTTAINFTDGSLTQPVKFDIHVTKGNYFTDNAKAKALAYTVDIEDTNITDSHDGSNTLPVSFAEAVSGTLDLTKDQAHADSDAYSGSMDATLTPNGKAGSYTGKAQVIFTADVASAKSN